MHNLQSLGTRISLLYISMLIQFFVLRESFDRRISTVLSIFALYFQMYRLDSECSYTSI